jgi:hypothetical protein
MVIGVLLSLWLSGFPEVFSAGQTSNDIHSAIVKLEEAIAKASDLHESGSLKFGNPFKAQITSTVSISFTAETFDEDLERAFDLYKRMMAAKDSKGVGAKEHLSRSSKKAESEENQIDALKQAEKISEKNSPKQAKPAKDFSVFSDYQKTHQEKIRHEDQAAEGDMKGILAERRATENEQLQKLKTKQDIQSQSMKWQAQLDKQASESARKAAEWEAQHSFGAYARTFFATVVQTAVGSFTGGLLTPIATELANKAVKQWFGIDPKDIDKPPDNDNYNNNNNNNDDNDNNDDDDDDD